MEVPKCCGKEMRVSEKFGAFTVMECDKCKNVIYVKGDENSKPQLIDD